MRKNFLRTTMLVLAVIAAGAALADEPAKPSFLYDLTFKGQGESTYVDDVTIENLSKGTIVHVLGRNTLRLLDVPTGIESVKETATGDAKLMNGKVVFSTTGTGNASVTVYNLNGLMASSQSVAVDGGSYEVSLPSMLAQGIYIVRVQAPGLDKSFKYLAGVSQFAVNTVAETMEETFASEIEPIEPADLPSYAMAPDNSDIVEMLYEKGDVLRFTGQSGRMKTIVTNVPTLSHDIVFDFYDCTDAAGYTYAIVNAGGMLWMAEDLRYVGNSEVALMKNKDMWQQYDADKPMAVFKDFNDKNKDDVYYNFAAAKKALPEGWSLPTANEVEYVGEMLGGMKVAGQALKSQNGEWATAVNCVDSVSVSFKPCGYLNESGEFKGVDLDACHMTRTTKNSRPVIYEVKNADGAIHMDKEKGISSNRMAFHVRGCRPAPSAYNAIIESFKVDFFENSPAKAPQVLAPGMVSQPRRAPQVYDNGPVGSLFTRRNAGDFTMKNQSSYKPDEINNVYQHYWQEKYNDQGIFIDNLTDFNSTNKFEINKELDTKHNRCVRKAVAQRLANGLSRPIVVWFDKDFEWENRESILGQTAPIKLDIYGDKSENFEYKKEMELSQEYSFPNSAFLSDYEKVYYLNDNNKFYYQNMYMCRFLFTYQEYCAQRMDVSTGDIDGDQNEEILIALGSKLVMLNGSDLSEMGYVNVGGWALQVFTIGDANNDGINDIIQHECGGYTEKANTVRIYYGSKEKNCWEKLKANPNNYDVQFNVDYGEFVDVKVGDVTGDGKNNIVVYSSQKLAPYVDTNTISPESKIYVYNIDDRNNAARYKTIVEEADEFLHHRGVKLVNFRGMGYPLDIVGTRKIFSFNGSDFIESAELTKFERYYHWAYRNDEDKEALDECYYPRDAMVVGDFLGNGTEQLAYLCMHVTNGRNDEYYMCGHGYTKAKVMYYEDGQFKKKEWGSYSDVSFSVIGNHTKDKYIGYKQWFVSWPYMTSLLGEQLSVMKYKGRDQNISEPRIYALLAAPPYFDGYEYEDSPGTSWGKSTRTGVSKSSGSSNSASLILGFEYDISFFGVKLGGIDFETEFKSQWSNSTEETTTTSYSIDYTTFTQDAVVMEVTPFDTYTYEIISSPNPDDLGGLVTASIPYEPRTLVMSLADYTRLRADNKEIPDLRNVFTHTVGEPFTYPYDKSAFPGNALWGQGSADKLNGTGSGGKTSIGIELDSETAETSEFNFDMDVQLVASAGNVKAGAGYGHGESKSTTHTEGEGFAIGADVVDPHGYADLPAFRWNVCWYKQKLKGQTFPVVNYLVKK